MMNSREAMHIETLLVNTDQSLIISILCFLFSQPNTIPQGVVNMYQCTNVFDADNLTGKEHSMGIVTPDETTYIRAETREEKDRYD